MNDADMLDLVYPLQGGDIAADHAHALCEQLRTALPWLDDDPRTGVHPIRGTSGTGASVLLSGRATLRLRIPRGRRDDSLRLQDITLHLPAPVRVGVARERALLPHHTLYAPCVVTGQDDEIEFTQAVRALLQDWQVAGDVIVGRQRQVHFAAESQTGFSLMLHGLNAAASLRAQTEGIGQHRLCGCGLFVPHRSAEAVYA